MGSRGSLHSSFLPAGLWELHLLKPAVEIVVELDFFVLLLTLSKENKAVP